MNGNGRAQVGNDEIRLSLNIRAGLAFNGSLSYYDGRRWLVSTGTCGFKINGRVAKLKGVGRWGSRDVVYYLQVKDRSPKRADTMSIKVKAGKSVVLRQSAALTSGDLAVHG